MKNKTDNHIEARYNIVKDATYMNVEEALNFIREDTSNVIMRCGHNGRSDKFYVFRYDNIYQAKTLSDLLSSNFTPAQTDIFSWYSSIFLKVRLVQPVDIIVELF